MLGLRGAGGGSWRYNGGPVLKITGVMMSEIIGYLGFGSALIGFVAVFIKIGDLKGKFTEKIHSHEDRLDRNEKEISILMTDFHGLQEKTMVFMAEMKTSLVYIRESLSRLEQKLDKGDGNAP